MLLVKRVPQAVNAKRREFTPCVGSFLFSRESISDSVAGLMAG